MSCDEELQYRTINYQDIDAGFPNVNNEFKLSVQLKSASTRVYGITVNDRLSPRGLICQNDFLGSIFKV